MASYKDLIVWQKALRLSKQVYRLTDCFPQSQKFGLCDQMQRAAVSIMSNVAEGSRRTHKEWVQFVRIAFASAGELESQLLLSQDLGFGKQEQYKDIFEEVGHISRILSSFLRQPRT
jgi:four helix bundle protein